MATHYLHGTGTGDMLKSDNLAGLADVSVAKTNLSLGTMADEAAADYQTAAQAAAAYAPKYSEVRLHYDAGTGEMGMQVRLLNKTGGPSVKGEIIGADSAVDMAFDQSPADALDPIGIVAESGIADGSACWLWMPGSVCQVLLKDSTASTRGHWCRVSADTNGRMTTSALPSPPTDATHFREIGHCLESKLAGTNVLARIALHVL